ncbi:MAG: NAD-dependent epimerase/dehydratase family protein [Rikenellaceae bacterium]
MSKRAIVLGGAGLIGSHLCIKLLKEGCDVVCIDKRGQRESPLLRHVENRDKFHYIKHDITIPYNIGCDELYNLASPIEFGDDFDIVEELHQITMGAINALNTLIDNNSKVLYGSSDDVYNFDKLDQRYTSNKRFLADAKRFGESIHRAYNAKFKIDTRIARIFSTYGAYAGLRDQHVINKMIIKALNNQDITIYGSGNQQRTFCWVNDIVDGIIKLMRTPNSNGVLTADLGSSTTISIRELAEMIISLTGSRSNIFHVAARVEELPYKVPDLKIAEDQLDWHASTSLREGLQRTISYIEKELSTIAMSQMSWVEIYG